MADGLRCDQVDPHDGILFPPQYEDKPLERFIAHLSNRQYEQTSCACLRVQVSLSRLEAARQSGKTIRKVLSVDASGYMHLVWAYSATGMLCETFIHGLGKHWRASWKDCSFCCADYPMFPGRVGVAGGRDPFKYEREYFDEEIPPPVVRWWEHFSDLKIEPIKAYLLNRDMSFSQLADLLAVGAPWT